jgi:hypothetical protein
MPSPGESTHAELDGGWVLPPSAARQAVHTRSIVCRSFRRDDGLFDVDGRFIDTRPFKYYSPFRGDCEEGSALHNMQMRLTMDRGRHIVSVQAAMAATPYTSCSGVLPNFQALVGVSLGRGFKKTLHERLGGVLGCTHYLALLEAMAAAAVQTFASDKYAPRAPGEAEPVHVFKLEALTNSCHSYAEDGPVIAAMRTMGRE